MENYSVTVFVDHDLVHNGHITSGLLDLEAMGLIKIKWKMPLRMTRKKYQCCFVLAEVQFSQGVVKLGFDFHDHNIRFDEGILEQADLYYKSNYNLDALETLPVQYREKVRPYGFYFPLRSRTDQAILFRLYGSLRANLSWDRSKGWLKFPYLEKLYSRSYLRYERYMGRCTADVFELGHRNDKNNHVYFNPGCWPMTSDDNVSVNLLRRDIIIALKKEFKENARVGFVPNATSLEYFPDEIFDEDSDHRKYVESLTRSRVVVSTNGLLGCHSWRTGEALASGAAVVTERPINKVDNFILERKNIYYYSNAQECLEACVEVFSLKDDEYQNLRFSIKEYYFSQLAPSACARNKINAVLARFGAQI